MKKQTLSNVFGGQVRITGGAIFHTGGANAPPVKELKNALRWSFVKSSALLNLCDVN